MPVKPVDVPDWATDLTQVTAPGGGLVAAGWAPGDEPAAQHVNYQLNRSGQWHQWADDSFPDVPRQYIPAIAGEAFTSAANFSRSVKTGVISITGTGQYGIDIPVMRHWSLVQVDLHVVWGSVPPPDGTLQVHLEQRGQGAFTSHGTYTATGEAAGVAVLTIPATYPILVDGATAQAYYVRLDNASIPGGTPHELESLDVTLEWVGQG